MRTGKSCGCTYHGHGSGYGYIMMGMLNQKPTWGECKNNPGGCPKRTWGTSGFKTNEFFISRFKASMRAGALTSRGSSQKPRDRHPDCPPLGQMKKSTGCRPATPPPTPAPATPPPTPAPATP
eukprot:Sspe_Gene.52705::Locus_29177_Transcript_1_1_Confidence_1.000_Length_601::g.52705::m.52705